MAATPGFGGTNGVAELNLGQPGSARATAQTADYAVRVPRGDEEDGTVVHQLAEQPVSFAENTGFQGFDVTWDGLLRVASIDELEAIRSHVSEFRTGQTITAGVRSAVDPDKMKATKLTDYWAKVISEKAKMTSAIFGEVRRLSNNATFSHACQLTIRFRVLG